MKLPRHVPGRPYHRMERVRHNSQSPQTKASAMAQAAPPRNSTTHTHKHIDVINLILKNTKSTWKVCGPGTRKGCQQSIYSSLSPTYKATVSLSLYTLHHYSTPPPPPPPRQGFDFSATMTSEEDWVRDAMTDDAVVVEMLLRLHAAGPPRRKALEVEWTVRQRRSRPASSRLLLTDSSNSDGKKKKKKAETARASPTTPLSWSGATSHSGGGFEESSRPARSKVVAGTSETTTTKRSRKKKTLAELKEEECLLLKESRSLKNELATLRLRLENQRSTNESLKRMKLDLQSHHTFKTVTSSVASEETISDQLQHVEPAIDPSPSSFPAIVQCQSSLMQSSSAVQEAESRDTGFLLPDLNLPLDDDSYSKVLHETC